VPRENSTATTPTKTTNRKVPAKETAVVKTSVPPPACESDATVTPRPDRGEVLGLEARPAQVQLGEDDPPRVRDPVQCRRHRLGVVLLDRHDQLVVFVARLVPVRPDNCAQPIEVAEVLGGEREHDRDSAEERFGWALVQQGALVDHDQPVADLLELAQDV
jgi:hypothetical protein